MIDNNTDLRGHTSTPCPAGTVAGWTTGSTFYVEDKLRTLLWGWLGEALSEEERDGAGRVLEGLDGELGRGLAGLLGAEEVEALAERCTQLLDDGIFPPGAG